MAALPTSEIVVARIVRARLEGEGETPDAIRVMFGEAISLLQERFGEDALEQAQEVYERIGPEEQMANRRYRGRIILRFPIKAKFTVTFEGNASSTSGAA